MNLVTCNFCGADDCLPVFTLLDMQLGAPGEFRLVRCTECGLLYLNPRPSWGELLHHYPVEYASYSKRVRDDSGVLSRIARQYGLRRRCRLVSQKQSRGRLLDVGCATGMFLDAMRKHGQWELYGVEPVALAAEVARQRFGAAIYESTLEEARLPGASFEVVTMWDVLEHIPDPSSALGEVHRILRPGGWLVLQVPNPASWQARLFGPYWAGYDAPRHVFAFPIPVLSRKLEALGYHIREMGCWEGGRSTFLRSLDAWWQATRGTKRGIITRTLGSTGGRLVLGPFFGLLRFLRLGPSVTLVAAKQGDHELAA